MKRVTPKIFIKQLIVKDLFGKDSQRGVSLTYAWLANQLGHFSLGFFPSIVMSIVLKNQPPIYYSYYVILFWGIFELINLTMPIFINHKKNTFKPSWNHLIFDTITDLLYFILGALASAYLLTLDKNIGFLTIFILVMLIYPFVYWYTSRIYQQYAYFPFQYRISQWIGTIDEDEKNTILNYIHQKSSPNKHLLIFGNVHEGKTNLGVAIANELALKKQSCTYITATKLYSLLFEHMNNDDLLWSWKSCNYLIIDDINPDNLKHNKLLKPDDFLCYVDNFSEINTENRTLLKHKNVIWILGTNEKQQKNDWCNILEKIGIDSQNVYCINLSD